MRQALKSYAIAVSAGLVVSYALNFTFDRYWIVRIGKPVTHWMPPLWAADFGELALLFPPIISGVVVGVLARPYPMLCAVLAVGISVGIDAVIPWPHLPAFFGDFFVLSDFLKDVILFLLGCASGGYFRRWLA
jgi:hypothetical protein